MCGGELQLKLSQAQLTRGLLRLNRGRLLKTGPLDRRGTGVDWAVRRTLSAQVLWGGLGHFSGKSSEISVGKAGQEVRLHPTLLVSSK